MTPSESKKGILKRLPEKPDPQLNKKRSIRFQDDDQDLAVLDKLVNENYGNFQENINSPQIQPSSANSVDEDNIIFDSQNQYPPQEQGYSFADYQRNNVTSNQNNNMTRGQKQSYPNFGYQQNVQHNYLYDQSPLDKNHPLMKKYNNNLLDYEHNLLPFIPTAKEILHQQSMRDVRGEILNLRGNILESQQKLRNELESIRSDVIKSTMKKNYAQGQYNQQSSNRIGGVWSNYGTGKSYMDGEDNFYKKIDVGTAGYGDEKWQIPVIDFDKVYGQINRKFEELRNPNYVNYKEGDILDTIYGEVDNKNGNYQGEALGGFRFNPEQAAIMNIKSKYLDQVLMEDREQELNTENRFLDIMDNNFENSMDNMKGLGVVNESQELRTDSKMTIGVVPYDKEEDFGQSGVDHPAYNHSIVSGKTRGSIVMNNLDNQSKSANSRKNLEKKPSAGLIDDIITIKTQESRVNSQNESNGFNNNNSNKRPIDVNQLGKNSQSLSHRLDSNREQSELEQTKTRGYIEGDMVPDDGSARGGFINKKGLDITNNLSDDEDGGYKVGEQLGGTGKILDGQNGVKLDLKKQDSGDEF